MGSISVSGVQANSTFGSALLGYNLQVQLLTSAGAPALGSAPALYFFSSQPAVVAPLLNGVPYQLSVQVVTTAGTSPFVSLGNGSITLTSQLTTPTSVNVSASAGAALLSWQPPADTASAASVLNYSVVSLSSSL